MIIVVGHRNPDTDAAVSAVALAYLLRRKGLQAEAFVVGEPQPEAKAVLAKTRLGDLRTIKDVRVRASDIATRDVLYVGSGEPVKRAIDILVARGVGLVPIVDKNAKVLGVFTAEVFAKRFMEQLSSLRLTLAWVPLRNFLEISGSRALVGSPESPLRGRVYVAAMSLNSIRARSGELRGNIVVTGDRPEVMELLLAEIGVSALIVTGGREPPQSVVERARVLGTPLIVSPYDTYTTLRLLDLCQPVDLFMEPPVTVHEGASVSEVRELLSKWGVRRLVVVDEVGRLRGVITRSDLVKDYRKRVALVDHNELSQGVDGLEEANVVAVVDHHRVSGDIKTVNPILFRVEPVGSTATIMWTLFKEHGVEAPKELMEAMLYAILSDTMLLKAPSTTDADKVAAEDIATRLGLDLAEVVNFMRSLMALNEPSNPAETVTQDLKEYEYMGKRFGIAQVHTTDPKRYLNLVREIVEIMVRELHSRGLHFLVLMVTDIVEEKSYLTAVGHKDIVERALGVTLPEGAGFAELKGVTSRKSQVLPKLLERIERESLAL